ncbi:hypothetical protein C8J57DRAFT_1268065 [Mycena rebaudengoi]|nr:hypothetical protein C8J57DRAFT_1268065 [Mycena rebaudengoi]
MAGQSSRPAPSRLNQSFTSDQTGGRSMAETNFPGNSTKTLPSTVGRHDGHADGHLNCVAIRHGWTRTFSISPDELAVIDYETLERILEINTLRLRPMGLRIFIEQPADSATWSKVRQWKHDNSLQSILVQQFLEERRAAGVVTRFDVRDGADRRDDSSDANSLRSVGSRIVHGMHQRGDTTATASSTARRSWFGTLIRRPSAKTKQRPVTEDEAEGGAEMTDAPAAKQSTSTSLFGYLNPLSLFSSSPAPAVAEAENLMSPEETRAAEVENLRKRGWMPPGLARRQKSLRDRLRASEGRNPFLGASRIIPSQMRPTQEEITPQDVDEFFEIDRSSSILEMSNQPEHKEKSWRLKGKNKKNKGKGKGKELGGATIVKQAVDAFPDSPHHSRNNVDKINEDE